MRVFGWALSGLFPRTICMGGDVKCQEGCLYYRGREAHLQGALANILGEPFKSYWIDDDNDDNDENR